MVSYVYGYLRSFYSVLLMASFIPFLVYFILSWGDHLRVAASVHAGGRAALYRRQGPGRGRRHGARLRGRQLSAGRIIERGQRDPVCVRQPALLAGGGSDERIPEPGPLYRDAAGADSAAHRGASERRAGASICSLLASVGLLHLFALNLLYPKFVGSRVHLNPLAVTIALMLWGILWGGIGLILAIPITAGIKAICDNVSSLKPYGRLLGD